MVWLTWISFFFLEGRNDCVEKSSLTSLWEFNQGSIIFKLSLLLHFIARIDMSNIDWYKKAISFAILYIYFVIQHDMFEYNKKKIPDLCI